MISALLFLTQGYLLGKVTIGSLIVHSSVTLLLKKYGILEVNKTRGVIDMKKSTMVCLIAVLVLSLAGAVALAAPGANPGLPGSFCPAFGANGQQINLTDEQKAQIETWHKERIEHRKQVLQKQVEWGWLTQEQADQQISFMEQRNKDGNFGMGMGPGRGHGMGYGRGMGPMQGGCPNYGSPAQQ